MRRVTESGRHDLTHSTSYLHANDETSKKKKEGKISHFIPLFFLFISFIIEFF